MSPFRIETDPADYVDLQERLRRIRWPGNAPDNDDDGPNAGFLRRLMEHWRERYDWWAAQQSLNRLPQFMVSVDGMQIHTVFAAGRGPRPLPLLLTHGWPSTFTEFTGIMGRLTDPQAYGGDPADAFDVAIPSLPGFVFSDPLPNGSIRHVTTLWVKLMSALGYERFGAHGGDIGAFVTNRLAIEHPDHLVGIHTGFPAEPAFAEDLDDEERRFLDHRKYDRESGGAYAHIQRTRPWTLTYALSDSPTGLAAWILDKWRDWTDCDGDLRNRFTFDDLLTVVNLYWLTKTIGTSFRFYREWGLNGDPDLISQLYPSCPPGTDAYPLASGERIEVPAAVALFKARFPEQYVRRSYTDLRRFTIMPRGGHFPALEEPDLLVNDLRRFFRPLRNHPIAQR
nr:epoxide hydrolase family protein [uncultured Actinoplanes sp.]